MTVQPMTNLNGRLDKLERAEKQRKETGAGVKYIIENRPGGRLTDAFYRPLPEPAPDDDRDVANE